MNDRYTFTFAEPTPSTPFECAGAVRSESTLASRAAQIAALPASVLMLDQLVPGVQWPNTKLGRLPKAVGSDQYDIRVRWILEGKWLPLSFTVPTHGAGLAAAWLSTAQPPVWYMVMGPAKVPASLPALQEEPDSRAADCLKAHESAVFPLLGKLELEPLTSYQRKALGLGAMGYTTLALHWPPGSGKSRGAMLWAMAINRPVVVITPSQVKQHWERQVKRYAPGASPFVWTAPSLRRKKDVPFDEWLNACQETRKVPMLIVGHETMVDAWESGDIRSLVKVGADVNGLTDGAWQSTRWLSAGVACILDEAHLFRNPKRWKGTLNDDGTFRFSQRRTSGGKKSEALVLADIARWASARCCLTATPIANRLDQYWVQLDFLDPGGFGSYWNFCARFVPGSRNQYGAWESATLTDGAKPPNADELRHRLSWFNFEVSYSESHGQLPPKRRLTTYLGVAEQVTELGGWGKILKDAAKNGPNAVIEAQLMRAASRKRKYIAKRVVEFATGGKKVVVLTGRRKDADALGILLWGKLLAPFPIDAREKLPIASHKVWWAHGGVDQGTRGAYVDSYMAWSPSENEGHGCVLVGTVDCFGIGIDLQDTDLLIMAMLPRTWDVLWQAENRVSRLGMTRDVIIEYPIAEGTVDESIATAFLEKLPAIGALTADEEVGLVGESLRGLSDPESLLDAIWAKVTGVVVEGATT